MKIQGVAGRVLSVAMGLAGVTFAAAPAIEVSGNYVEARTADVFVGACFANSEVQLVGNLAVMGWKIDKGSWRGVSLDGLGVAAAVKAKSTLGDWTGESYPVKAVLIVDEKATLEQRDALRQFAQFMSGDLLSDIVAVEKMPIQFTVNAETIHERKVTMTAGTLASIQTRAIVESDKHCAHEVPWYEPLSKMEHAMPAYALDHQFTGKDKGLDVRWSSPDKRSAFVGTFHISQ
jgi:hypothetical protein